MAVIEGGSSAALAGVAVEAASGMHMIQKPIAYGALGHYRITYRAVLAAAQAANGRLFEARNNHASNLVIPTRLIIRVLQIAAGTAQENSVDVYKCTAFTAVDTTNTTTPVASRKRSSMAAAPGSLDLRGVTLAGAAAGMTGGTLTKDTSAFASLPFNVAAAINTNGPWGPLDVLDDVNGTHPWVFVQNEGFIIENRVLNVTSYGCAIFVDFSWAETTLF